MALNVIEKGVPIPKSGTNAKYKWGDMEIGDSIAFATPDAAGSLKILAAARIYGKRNNKTFLSRRSPKGIRIWRMS